MSTDAVGRCDADLRAWRSPAVLATVTDSAQQIVDRQLVIAALQTLSTEHREVLLECFFRGASVAEAAETLGVPARTVKSRTHYALRALRLTMQEMGVTA